MENQDWKITKSLIKAIAKEQGKTLDDIINHWGITRPGLDKRIQSKNFLYSREAHDLAEYLECSLEDFIYKPKDKPDTQPKVYNDDVSENSVTYKDRSKKIKDELTELQILRKENEALKKLVESQENMIDFLRDMVNTYNAEPR